mmetsp:Transcript_13057/g.17989  ORF Transcript_13057/g.17989 Transcript_13057/m.17989 type:complete len:216 (+) Transcript_13057:95-742(+)
MIQRDFSLCTYSPRYNAFHKARQELNQKTSATHPRKIYFFQLTIFLLVWDLNLSIINARLNITWTLAVNTASNGIASTKNLLHGSGKFLGHGPLPHNSGNINHLIKGKISIVDYVLNLLSVTDRLVECLHNKSRGGVDKGHSGLTVHDRELNSHVHALPVQGGLLDIFTDLLGGKAEGTNLRSEGGSRSYLTTYGTHNHDLNVIRRRRAHGVYRR